MQRREFLQQLASGLLVATAGPIVAPTRKVFRMGVALSPPARNWVFWRDGGSCYLALVAIDQIPTALACTHGELIARLEAGRVKLRRGSLDLPVLDFA